MADYDIVRRGYMIVSRNPRQGVLGKVMTVTSHKYWVELRKDSARGGKRCIQLYRNEEHHSEPTRTFYLDKQSLKSVQKVEAKKAFVLNLHDHEVCMFQCASRADMDDWYRDVQKYLVSGQPSSVVVHPTPAEGEIYEIVPDDETFRVKLRRSDSLSYSGVCNLEILKDFDHNLFHIAIYTDHEMPRLIVKWQIDHIRQYGSNQSAFKFESGSKSPTGADWFIMDTDEGVAVKIHKAVDYWAKHIVENAQNTGRHQVRAQSSLTNSIPPPTVLPNKSQSLPTNSGHYMSLNTNTQQGNSVYATAGNDKPRYPQPSNAVDNRSTYQALQPTAGQNDEANTYQGLNPRTVEPAAPNARRNQQPPSNETYMGLNARTRNPVESQQYMDLNQAQSNYY